MAKTNRHLILFLKAPRYGAVKSRLARDVGPLAAWIFYRRTLQATFRRLGRDRRWQTWVALAPDRARFRPSPRRTFAQGPGDIGRRMARALGHPPPGPAVLIGGDIPAVRPAHVAEAFRRLGAHDAVFGPALDGGYWLVGFSRRRPILKAAFTGVRWSSRHALADTLANLRRARVAPPLPQLEDIDDGQALARFISPGAR